METWWNCSCCPLRRPQAGSLYCSSEVRQAPELCSVGFASSPLTLPSFFLSDDPFFCLLHLWTHWGHPEFSVPSGSDEEDLFPLSSASGLHVSRMHWDRRLHPVFLAHVSTSQLRAEEDVLWKGTFAAPLSWNGRESEFCTFSAHCEHGMKTVVKTWWTSLQLRWEFEELDL